MGGDLIVNSIPTDGHLTKIFCPGAGDLPFDIIEHAILVRSLEPRIEKTGSPETFYFLYTRRVLGVAYFCWEPLLGKQAQRKCRDDSYFIKNLY
jgi:hypothetical protein